MGARQRDWARRAMAHLHESLGSRCRRCGRFDDLEVDCIVPQGHDHHTGSTGDRVSFYRKQAQSGNVQLLCHDCHAAKTRSDEAANLAALYCSDPMATPSTSSKGGGNHQQLRKSRSPRGNRGWMIVRNL